MFKEFSIIYLMCNLAPQSFSELRDFLLNCFERILHIKHFTLLI